MGPCCPHGFFVARGFQPGGPRIGVESHCETRPVGSDSWAARFCDIFASAMPPRL